MPAENMTDLSPPLLVYIVMGLVTARILLAKTDFHFRSWLVWLRFLVKAGSITFFWPLVLFIKNLETWLRSNE